MKKRLIPAWRVSTEEQQEKGYSVGDQIAKCTEYIVRVLGAHALEPIGDNLSGSTLNRPGLDRIRQMLRDGEADGVVWLRSDRMTRSLAHSLLLREEFSNAGVELYFVNRGQALDTPEGKMMEDVEAMFAEFWRKKLIEDMTRGKIRKVREGKILGRGNIPYGYRLDENGKAQLSEQWPVVKEIFTRYLAGERAQSIAEDLTRRELPSPGDLKPGRRYRAERTWTHGAVMKVLHNETYVGKHRFGLKAKLQSALKGEVLVVDVPPIVSQEQFDEAQQLAQSNKFYSKRNGREEYKLRGMIRCEVCGYVMQGRMHDGKPQYCCPSRTHQKTGHTCKRGAISESRIWPAVWGSVVELIESEEVFENGIRELELRHRAQVSEQAAKAATLDRTRKKLKREIDNLVQQLGRTKGAVAAAVQDRADRLSEAYDKLEEESVPIEAPAVDDLRAIRERVLRGLERAKKEPEKQRQLLEALELVVLLGEGDSTSLSLNLLAEPVRIDLTTFSCVEINCIRLRLPLYLPAV